MYQQNGTPAARLSRIQKSVRDMYERAKVNDAVLCANGEGAVVTFQMRKARQRYRAGCQR